MLKGLIIGADSVSPEIVIKHQDRFPTLKKMISNGAMASYSTFVQKGYKGSYSSEQNWASIYTGLTPRQHDIHTHFSRGEQRRPQMKDFDTLRPFWGELNKKGLSVGLWAADNCVQPVEIEGYVISAYYEMIDTPISDRKAPRILHACKKAEQFVAQVLKGEPPYRLYPKTLLQQGYHYEDLQKDSRLAMEVIKTYHFQDALANFEEELKYWFDGIKKAQEMKPVDVLYFYTPTTDLIAHCCMWCDDNEVLLAAYGLLDRYMGELINSLKPEITVFLSDHGQQNFKELIKCQDEAVKREAFAARDEVIWLENGYIAFQAHNGALLFTAHALKGTFIAYGKGIAHQSVSDMYTVDIYPTILEMFEINVPADREGFVMDIFNRPIINSKKLFEVNAKKEVALIQSHDVNIMDIIINEVYLEDRWRKITIVGEEKYQEIFLNNPRVYTYVSFKDFNEGNFDEIFTGIYYSKTGELSHIKIGSKK